MYKTTHPKQYFFTLEDDQELVNELYGRVVDFQDYVIKSGKALAWQKNKDYYENKFYTTYEGLDITDAGEQGELLAMSVNEFRNILRHMLNPIASNTPSFTVSSVNSDVDSRRGADIGKQVINYYEKVKRFSKVTKRTAEYAVVYGDGYHVEEWNPLLGEEVLNKQTASLEAQGDFDPEAISVWDMFFDFTKKGRRDWYIFRRRKNKYDIAASFPEDQQERILNLAPFYQLDRYYKDVNFMGSNTDEIFVYSAYHRATPALPKGAYILFAADTTKAVPLYRSENIYGEDIPIFNMNPAQYLEAEFGFSDSNILRGLQEIYNDGISKAVTNLQSALKDIWVQKGEEPSIVALESGRNIIQSSTKPEVVDLYAGDNGIISFLEFVTNKMETLSAQNATMRGNIEGNSKMSGIALQTVISMGQQYAYGLQASYNELFEDINSFRLKVLKKFASTPRTIAIMGKTQGRGVVDYSKEDLKGVANVVVQQVNPVLNSPAGKIEIAQQLLGMGLPGFGLTEFFDVVNYGNLDAATESQKALIIFVQEIKEALLKGEYVPEVSGVDHKYLIKEVQALLMNLKFITDPANAPLVKNVTDFLTRQMNLMRAGDEISAMVYGGVPPTLNTPPVPQAIPQQGQPEQQGLMPNQGIPNMPQPQGTGVIQ